MKSYKKLNNYLKNNINIILSMSSIKKLVNDLNEFEKIKEHMASININIKETEKLYMLSFSNDADFSNEYVRQANGCIFEKGTNKIVHYSFEKCYETFEDSRDPYSLDNLSDYTIELYFEGSVIKQFYHDNKWNVATSRHIIADKNFWSSKKSFENLFKEAVELSFGTTYQEYLDTLDTKYCYTYLMQHPDNKMVMNITTPVVFIINRVNLETLVEERLEKDNLTIDKSLEEVLKDEQNYIIYKDNPLTGQATRIKILKESFIDKKKVRGNYPDIGLAYLENLCNAEKKQEIVDKFPEYDSKFSAIEDTFLRVSREIHSLYIKVYANKQQQAVPENYKKTLNQLHGQYRRTRTPITIDDVCNKFYTLNSKTLAYVLNCRY